MGNTGGCPAGDGDSRRLGMREDARVADLIRLNEALLAEIAERDATERALQESEERYRSLVDASSQVVWVADMMGRMNTGETSWTAFTGQTPDESGGDGWVNALHPDDRARTLLAWREALATQGPYEAPYRLRRRDGIYKEVVTRGVPVRDAAGNVREWIGACTDVTERRRAEEKYRSIFENAVEGIFQTCPEGRFLSVNPAMARIGGFESVEEMLREVGSLAEQHYADAGAREEFARLLWERGAVSDYQARIRRKDGCLAWISTHARAVRDSDGGILFFEGSVLDITARKTADDRLAHAYDATIEGWSRAMDLRDKETEGHSQRVTEMTLKLATLLGMSGEELAHVRRGALLHDIGKMGIPDSILLKPGPLDEREWATMRLHPCYAVEMLGPIDFLRPALDIPYAHHEKWDGTGYPLGLVGEQIPESARIFAVADVWDALRSDRPYRRGWSEARVREHIAALSETHLDPRVVSVFLSLPGD